MAKQQSEFEFVDINKLFNINIEDKSKVEFVTRRPPRLIYEGTPTKFEMKKNEDFTFTAKQSQPKQEERPDLVKKPKKTSKPKPAPRGIGYGPGGGEKEEVSYYSPKSSAILKTLTEIKELVKSRMERRQKEAEQPEG